MPGPRLMCGQPLLEWETQFFKMALRCRTFNGIKKVRTFPPDRPGETFAPGVRLRRPDRRPQHMDVHIFDALTEAAREDAIPVMNDVFIRMTAGQRLSKLLYRPFCKSVGS